MEKPETDLDRLHEWLGSCLRQASGIAKGFLDENTHKFVDYHGSETNRPHAVTSARAMVSLAKNRWLKGSRLDFPSNDKLLAVFSAAKTADGFWSSDPNLSPSIYDGAQVLWALESLGIGEVEELKLHRLLMRDFILSYRYTAPLDPNIDIDRNHPFILFLATRALAAGANLDQETRSFAESCFQIELAAQLALLQVKDLYSFDLIRLGISIAGLLCMESDWRPKTIEQASDIFMDCLVLAGRWSPARNTVRVGKQFVGCSSIEIILEILRHYPVEWFQRHASKFKLLEDWLLTQNVNPLGIPRWRSDTSPHVACWFNFLTLDLLEELDIKIGETSRKAAIRALPGRRSTRIFPWSELLDTGFKETINSRIITPIMRPSKFDQPARSAILFGPPGTAKTTIARALAKELGDWPLIELSPSDFCTNGIDNIFLNLKLVFDNLFCLNDAVVLFDEIDELVMAREAEREKFGRFLTTAMLPWFQQLRDLDNVIFVVNTNHVRLYDPAIRRPGRFDLVLPVGPPSKEQIKDFLSRSLVTSRDQVEHLVAAIEGTRTIGEILDLVRILRNLEQDRWILAAEAWNQEHLPIITAEMDDEFKQEIKKFSRR
jgi:hypothetical protein